MPTKKPKVATCTFGKCRKGCEGHERFQKCRKGFKHAGKVLKMQERFKKCRKGFIKLWERFLNCGKGYTAEKKWERFQNSRKGKGKESFQSLPSHIVVKFHCQLFLFFQCVFINLLEHGRLYRDIHGQSKSSY